MGNANRFFSVTTADKRSALEDAWEDSADNENGALRKQLRANLREAQAAVEGGAVVQSSSSNGHSGSYFEPGTGAPAPAEIARLWQDLVDRYDTSKAFLIYCAKNTLDAFAVKLGCGGTPIPVDPALVLDPQGLWAPLCDQFGIAQADVIGAAVDDSAVFLWMMDNLVAITESRSDYGNLRLTGGAFV